MIATLIAWSFPYSGWDARICSVAATIAVASLLRVVSSAVASFASLTEIRNRTWLLVNSTALVWILRGRCDGITDYLNVGSKWCARVGTRTAGCSESGHSGNGEEPSNDIVSHSTYSRKTLLTGSHFVFQRRMRHQDLYVFEAPGTASGQSSGFRRLYGTTVTGTRAA